MAASRSENVEITLKESCPCESGLRYGECCKLKEFKWMRDEDGELSQLIPISPGLGRVLETAQRKFKRIFGREPDDTDPILVEKYLVSERDVKRETEDAMLRAGLSPELLYAYRKTGRLLTQKNKRLVPDVDVDEWHSAIEEYRAIKAARFREPSTVSEIRRFVGELTPASCC